VVEFDGNCDSFIRRSCCCCDLAGLNNFRRSIPQPTQLLRRRNHENDLAFRCVGLVIRKKFTGGTVPKFFEFFCEFSRDAKLPIRHDIDAGAECLG
jgi:hypothetical protein